MMNLSMVVATQTLIFIKFRQKRSKTMRWTLKPRCKNFSKITFLTKLKKKRRRNRQSLPRKRDKEWHVPLNFKNRLGIGRYLH